jgi:thiol-disulfide isomerase/thioredoxin
MLKKNMVFALVLSALSIAAFAQKKEKTAKTEASATKPKDAFNITITVKGYPERMFYLGYYFGDKQYLRDSAYTDKNGTMNFKGDKTLEGGVYLIATAQKSLLFDFVVTEQFFSLETDSVDVVKNMKVKGSSENEIFFTYTKYTTVMGRRAYELDEQIKAAKAANDTAAKRIAETEYKKITGELVEYRKQLMKENPNALLSKIFKIMTDIEIPEAPRNSQGIIIDSNYQYQYYYNHYFDNFDWSDERIVRTPVFHNKFEAFITKLTPQIPDSIIKSADVVLKKAEAGKENFKYVLFWITNHYETSQYMGMDKVFVYMVDNYYAKGKAFWVDETLKAKMEDRANNLRSNLIGNKAPNLTMLDTAHVYHSLHNIKANYSLVVFWDAGCGKCKEEMPKLKKIFEEFNPAPEIKKGKTTPIPASRFFDIYGVSLTPDANDWVKYLKENKLPWLNVYDPNNETGFRKLYDIYSTPVLYLLDENKKIIAKRISADQVKDIIKDMEQRKGK